MKTPDSAFSDENLRATRQKLLARGALLADRVQRVRADLGRDDGSLPLGGEGVVIVRENGEMLRTIEKFACSEITRIDAALERMEEGVFGLCEECSGEIEAECFVARPDAARCKACARDA
jgi:DnaK suppressor protein